MIRIILKIWLRSFYQEPIILDYEEKIQRFECFLRNQEFFLYKNTYIKENSLGGAYYEV
ncbi:hypothetical protein UT300003_04820 [Clostridium sardiniense]